MLSGIDLRIPAGQFVAVVGASGCGKSTLLRLILGLDDAHDGSITLGGAPVLGTSPDRGIVFQDHRLFPWLNVAQNIAVGLRNAPRSASEKRELVAEHIALVGLEGFEQSYRTRSPAAWRSAWRSRAAWSTALACCCWTSPSARWTR